LNGVLDKVDIRQGSLRQVLDNQFLINQAPLVLVNILAPVIINLFKEGLAELVVPGGKMVLAGILESQADLVMAAARASGLKFEERLQQDDWVGLIFTK